MAIMSSIIPLINDINVLIKNDKNINKTELLYDYLKIKIINGIKHRLNLTPPPVIKLLNYKINYLNYVDLILGIKEIFINYCYFFRSVDNRPLILDCGSNIGLSILFFKMIYPDSRIISFEPDDVTFMKLQKNVQMNNLKNIELNNMAVSNVPGVKRFYYPSDQPGSGRMSLLKRECCDSFKEIKSTRLSDYITSRVDFLKLDIEGAEAIVIEELSIKGKLEMINEMVIEYHHHINPGENNLSKILSILENNGFGYQITADSKEFLSRNKFQDILIYAYRKKLL